MHHLIYVDLEIDSQVLCMVGQHWTAPPPRTPFLHNSHPSFESTLVLQVLSLSGASEHQPGYLTFTFWWAIFSVALLK